MLLTDKEYVDIAKLIPENYPCYAHRDGERRETLTEHTMLCRKYFEKLSEAKNFDRLLENFIGQLASEISEEGRKLIYEMFCNVVIFHDMGKLNPNFQTHQMENSVPVNVTPYGNMGKNHSFLSSVFYLNYYAQKINQNKEEKKILRPFLFINAYVISKHHGALGDFREEYLDKFEDGKTDSDIVETLLKHQGEIYTGEIVLSSKKVKSMSHDCERYMEKLTTAQAVSFYTYERFLYSVLVTCDYYATSEFMQEIVMEEFGNAHDMDSFYKAFEDTDINRSIRKYEKEQYPAGDEELMEVSDINILRNEIFLDSEREFKKHKEERIYYLEAPTGSGKSNMAFHLSLKMTGSGTGLNKIFYVYPFNTLVEQNRKSLEKVFKGKEEIWRQITVVNSVNSMKIDEEREDAYYGKQLLDRQFLNYPVILTTHVSLFDTMFGSGRESAFGFCQLANSVIVLDEIQSYKNTIWAEIITFLKQYALLLNMKVIIMSATLPNLDTLMEEKTPACFLVSNREKYFSHPEFKNRVKLHYDLLEGTQEKEQLYAHISARSEKKKKIVVEFIRKDSAYECYHYFMEEQLSCPVVLMTGDDNLAERERILNLIQSDEVKEKGMLLIATQVIEAGVDIDMDIGYKNISKLDSEEQFLGRVNRSCKKEGDVYFFRCDDPVKIYRDNIQCTKEFSLVQDEMKKFLLEKDFGAYYQIILGEIKRKYNNTMGAENLKCFFTEDVNLLKGNEIAERMKLIEEKNWSMQVFLAYDITDQEGRHLNGSEIWNQYKELLEDSDMNYSKKRILLYEIRTKMNYFIYEIQKTNTFCYDEQIGDIYYIGDGGQYFTDGKLDKEKFNTQIGIFI